MTSTETRFKDKFIRPRDGRPVLIVGQNPGKQRANQKTNVVWEGNKSSDLLMSIISDLENIYLTNVCNYQEMTDFQLEEGIIDLKKLIEALKPRVIICLGLFAKGHVQEMEPISPVVEFVHPSYVVRFNKDRNEYRESIRKVIQNKGTDK